MTGQEYAAGLREFADWCEANADTIEESYPYFFSVALTKYVSVGSKENLAESVKVLGRAKKTIDATGDFALIRDFGGAATVHVYAPRDTVCERVVTGTRIVTEQVRDPELLEEVPLVEVTREEDVVEWKCPESLLAVALDIQAVPDAEAVAS